MVLQKGRGLCLASPLIQADNGVIKPHTMIGNLSISSLTVTPSRSTEKSGGGIIMMKMRGPRTGP